MKYCINCVKLINYKDYCSEYNLKITSVGDAEVCKSYCEANKQRVNNNKEEINKKKQTRCRNCKNLLFDYYCKKDKKGMKNPNRSVKCDNFIEKK